MLNLFYYQKMKSPTLSIIVLVYNSELYLKDAIDSILNQTFKHFELIIIDDGSSDNCLDILNTFHDSRIKFLYNSENRGIVFSRNKGLNEANGKYIAMFDSDDIAYPSKFEKQIKFLEQNSDYGLIGSWVEIIDNKNNKITDSYKLCAKAKKIPSILLFRNYFINSAVVFRKDLLGNFKYPNGYDIGEDYFLWIFLSTKTKVWNLPEYLVKYRIHNNSVTKKTEALRNGEKKIFSNLFNKLDIEQAKHDYKSHFLIKNNDIIVKKNDLINIEKWIILLYSQNKKQQVYDRRIFIQVLFNRWLKVISKSKKIRVYSLWSFIKSRILWIYISRFIS